MAGLHERYEKDDDSDSDFDSDPDPDKENGNCRCDGVFGLWRADKHCM